MFQAAIEYVGFDATLLTVHNAVSREFPLQLGLNPGTTWILLINNVSADYTANNDISMTHCHKEQYKQQT